ncbi:D-alanyl-D-alanine carboxypeptidase [Actinomadura craniellae]|uniref:D-alanyl-D-alanine carboxypeptidase n=1 Tax=Actinomadura craniellae TaxID=2231787 RepID=A0A365H9V8_9ACTN|nr:D-alanyl-D-alanine carboxypeptidase [Actinomadura craniellae]RAY15063.1 D-alanyl-D-alanine carboxypeptidase [Actinomadura craniellae]
MGSVRRAVAALTTPLVAVTLVTPVTPAHAALEPVGGPRLGARGLVVDLAAGAPKPPNIKASSWIVADGDTGEVLGARDPHGHYLPASALKTLTAVALIPKLDPAALIRPTRQTCDVEGTKVGMTPKMQYKVSDLMHALMMVSGNDAALALAQAGGGLRPTLDTMNAEAKRLRAGDTLAGSTNGLDVDLKLNVRTQHTSSYDLALIMRQGLKLPAFRQYVGAIDARWPAPLTKEQRKEGIKVGGYPIYTHNKLLRPGTYRYPGMIGGKNGYTNAAQQTFVGAARRDGRTIIIALMRSPTLWPYATELFDWGFAAHGKTRPVGTLVDPVPPPKPPGADDSVLPPIPLTGGDSPGGWGLVATAAGGIALMVAAVVILARRRRPAAAPRPPAERQTAGSGGPPPSFGGPAEEESPR